MSAIYYALGDATHPLGAGPAIIAHCCNNIGVWGAGFVLALSKRWAEPEAEYRKWARQFSDACIPLGCVQFVPVGENITVANIIGQHATSTWKGQPPIRYEGLKVGFERVAREAIKLGASVHMPRLGCGLAGGSWEKVEPLIEGQLCARGVPVWVYDFFPAPTNQRRPARHAAAQVL